MARLRTPGPRRKGHGHGPRRPWPAPCLRDGCPRVARHHGRSKGGRLARSFCSDRCEDADKRQRYEQGTVADLANDIRRLLGLEGGRGYKFTAPELRLIRKAVTRLVDYRARHGD